MDKNEAKNLRGVIAIIEHFLSEYNNRDKNDTFWHLLHALTNLHKRGDEQGIGVSNLEFTYKEIEKEIGHREGVLDSGRMKKEYDRLSNRLSELEPEMTRIAKSLSLNIIPSVHKDSNNGGRGKKVYLRLKFKPIQEGIESLTDNETSSSTKILLQEPEIQYYLESKPKLPLWAKWCGNLDLNKKKNWLLALFASSPYFTGAFLFVTLAISIGSKSSGALLELSMLLSILYISFHLVFFRHFIVAIKNNIALMPDWMLPLRLKSAVLEFELHQGKRKPHRVKNISVKVYKAECPICGHRVDLTSGSLKYWGRIIGVCDANPVEHKYSFDHTIQSGFRL